MTSIGNNTTRLTGRVAIGMLAICSLANALPLVAFGVRLTDLRCEYLVEPLGIDAPLPRFSWKLVDAAKTRGQRQSACQVVVEAEAADSSPGRTVTWDAGRVASSDSVNFPYGGAPLTSGRNFTGWLEFDLRGYIVTNDRKQTGHFDCSKELFNRIYETDLRTYQACTVNGVTMDCPHRERFGYGDRQQLEKACQPMKRWLDYLHRFVSTDGVLTAYEKASRFLGDRATPHGSEYGDAPEARLCNNCVYAYCLDACCGNDGSDAVFEVAAGIYQFTSSSVTATIPHPSKP